MSTTPTTDRVPAEDIEAIVGVPRLKANHVLRAVSSEERAYILHPLRCVQAHPDLRECPFSVALGEYGLWGLDPIDEDDGYDWPEDEPVVVMLNEDGFLAPDPAVTKDLPGLIYMAYQ